MEFADVSVGSSAVDAGSTDEGDHNRCPIEVPLDEVTGS